MRALPTFYSLKKRSQVLNDLARKCKLGAQFHKRVNIEDLKGFVYFDRSSKGNGKFHNKWCAEICILKVRLRRRNKDKEELARCLNAVKSDIAKNYPEGVAANNFEDAQKDIQERRKELMSL